MELALDDAALMAAARDLANEAADAGKELLVFVGSDDEDLHVDLPNSLVFKNSLRGATQRSNEFAQPAWADDLLRRFGGW